MGLHLLSKPIPEVKVPKNKIEKVKTTDVEIAIQ